MSEVFYEAVVAGIKDTLEEGYVMAVRKATAEWSGNLKEGKGTVRSESGALDTAYDFPSRFESGDATNPEELIGAAHSACFSMALANILSQAGHVPESVRTEASVTLEKRDDKPTVTRIDLDCVAGVPEIDDETFQAHAEEAKQGCPISRALGAVEIHLTARLA